jgi:hypothetical protein
VMIGLPLVHFLPKYNAEVFQANPLNGCKRRALLRR